MPRVTAGIRNPASPRRASSSPRSDEMPGSADQGMGLVPRAGHALAEDVVHGPRNGIPRGVGAKERLLPAFQLLPGRAIGLRGRVRRRRGHQGGESTCTGLVASRGKRGIVGSTHRPGNRLSRTGLHDAADGKPGRVLGKRAPDLEHAGQALVAGRQRPVGHDDAIEPRLVLHRQAQADERPPVLSHQGNAAQVQLFQPPGHPVHVTLVAVVRPARRLVGTAEAHQVRGHGPVSGVGEHRDHLSIEVRPRGLSVHEQHHRPVGGPLVHVVDAQPVHLRVPWHERKIGQAFKARFGCSQNLHGFIPSSR